MLKRCLFRQRFKWKMDFFVLLTQAQFPEMRKKIDKRSRKLIDFDGERHALQALQANPRRAEAKLAKQRESLEAAKRTYEVSNQIIIYDK